MTSRIWGKPHSGFTGKKTLNFILSDLTTELAHNCIIFPCYLDMEINAKNKMNNNKNFRAGQLTTTVYRLHHFWRTWGPTSRLCPPRPRPQGQYLQGKADVNNDQKNMQMILIASLAPTFDEVWIGFVQRLSRSTMGSRSPLKLKLNWFVERMLLSTTGSPPPLKPKDQSIGPTGGFSRNTIQKIAKHNKIQQIITQHK